MSGHETPKIWLPDTHAQVEVDTANDGACTVYQQRITLTLQKIKPPKGFGGDHDDDK